MPRSSGTHTSAQTPASGSVPSFVPTANASHNMAPQIAGFSAPIVVGVLVSGGSFAPAFVAMVGAMVLSAVTHLLVRRAAAEGSMHSRPGGSCPNTAAASDHTASSQLIGATCR